MVDIAHNILEEDFNKNLSHTYNLSILIGIDRLSYIISNQENQVLALRAYQSIDNSNAVPFKKLLLEDSIIQAKFNSVKIGLFSPRFSLVPLSLFDKEQALIYLQQTTSLQQSDQIFIDTVNSLKAANVFAFEESYIKILLECFPEATFSHVSTGLINNFINNFDSNNSKNIFLNVYGQSVLITVVENKQLVFHNSFSFKASPDCLYFILLVYKQLGLNPQKHPLHILGELVVDSEIHKLLYKYIKTIHFVNRPNFYFFGDNIQKKLPSNFFFDLYSIKLSETY